MTSFQTKQVMMMTSRRVYCSAAVFIGLFLFGVSARGENRITILNDAFGRKADLKRDWGYSALIQYNGKRILFDTGGNISTLRDNVERMHVDLSHLDAVVISHSHGDHTSGLRYVLELNPGVPLYLPDDPEFRPREVPRHFLRRRLNRSSRRTTGTSMVCRLNISPPG